MLGTSGCCQLKDFSKFIKELRKDLLQHKTDNEVSALVRLIFCELNLLIGQEINVRAFQREKENCPNEVSVLSGVRPYFLLQYLAAWNNDCSTFQAKGMQCKKNK